MSGAPPIDRRGAYFWFDVLRWAAASLVVAEHLRDLIWLSAGQTGPFGVGYRAIYFATGFGSEAVDVFFVLSGFWISRSVANRLAGDGFWRPYLGDRLVRLMVVIVPALAIGGLCDAVARHGLHSPLHRGITGAITLDYDVAGRLTWATLAGNLGFLQTVAVPTFGSNAPLWSLANEFWYYIWFPALLLLARRRRPGLALLSLGIAIKAPHLLPGFAIWLLGALLAHADKRAVSVRYPAWTLVASGIALAAVASASRMQSIAGVAANLLVGVAFAGFAWTLLRTDPPRPRWARLLARYGASASFSLYAVHFPLLALLAALILGGRRLQPSAGAALLFALLFAAATALGWLFSRLTEARTARVRQWLARFGFARRSAFDTRSADDKPAGDKPVLLR